MSQPAERARNCPWGMGLRHFDHDEATVGPQDATHLGQGFVLILDVMEGDDRDDPIERPVRERQGLCVTFLEANRRAQRSAEHDLSAIGLQHDDFAAAGRKALGRRPGAATDIEKSYLRRRADEASQRDQVLGALPDAHPFLNSDRQGHELVLQRNDSGIADPRVGLEAPLDVTSHDL